MKREDEEEEEEEGSAGVLENPSESFPRKLGSKISMPSSGRLEYITRLLLQTWISYLIRPTRRAASFRRGFPVSNVRVTSTYPSRVVNRLQMS